MYRISDVKSILFTEVFMKKMTLLSLLAGGVLSLFAAESVPGRVTADRLNLRFAPELKSPVALRVDKDATLQLYGIKGQWLEVGAPESLKIYVSEAYIANGKTIKAIRMQSDKSATSHCLGVLPAGSEVKLIDDRGYGWVRIAPTESIRLYTAKMYVEFDEAQLTKLEAAKAAAMPAAPAAPEAPAAVEAKPGEAAPAPAATIPAPKEDVK